MANKKKYIIDTYMGKKEVDLATYAAYHIPNVWETADKKAEKIAGFLGRLMSKLVDKGFLTTRDLETLLKETE